MHQTSRLPRVGYGGLIESSKSIVCVSGYTALGYKYQLQTARKMTNECTEWISEAKLTLFINLKIQLTSDSIDLVSKSQ